MHAHVRTRAYGSHNGEGALCCRACGPHHLYAHYRNVDDALREVEDDLLAGLAEVTERVSGGDLPCMDFSVFLDETLAFVDRNRADFHVLLVAQPDMRFVSRWKDAMKANMTRRYPLVSARTHGDLITEMGASAIVGAYVWWMENPGIAGFEEAYLIEHPKGLFLVDTGWARAMSPKGEFDKKAQIKSLGTIVLYEVNQGQIPWASASMSS